VARLKLEQELPPAAISEKAFANKPATERHVMKLNIFALLIGTATVALTGGAVGLAPGALLGGRHGYRRVPGHWR
jgi:hypothetical protein